LFGSQAVGHTGPLSDVDLAVLWSEDESSPMLASVKLQQSIRDRLQDERVEVGPLNTQGIGFCFQVIRDGICLYGTERERVRFETRVLNEYHDLSAWLELHEKMRVA
jgi:predicted nucleotidyltransferase